MKSMNSLDELNSITHFGVLGMRWGKRKTNPNVHDDHRVGGKTRKDLEKKYNRANKKLGKKDAPDVTTLSDKKIRSVLKSPIMKKTLAEIKNQDQRKNAVIANTAAAAVIGTYYFVNSSTGQMLLRKVKQAARTAYENRGRIREAANVIDSHFVP